MERLSGPRKTASLSASLNQQLNGYALAASAAGVALLALAPSAEAKIVYTPKHVRLLASQPVPLDLNHDGKVDFYILNYYSRSSHVLSVCQTLGSYRGPFCASVRTNAIRAMVSEGRYFAAALRAGAKIQRGDRFFKFNFPLGWVGFDSSATYWRGPWFNDGKGVKNRYLGLEFKIKGRTHFGWARITVTTTMHDFTATLTGYAYETVPGKGIVAGQTKGADDGEQSSSIPVSPTPEPTLGALAMGAPGLSIWRREESSLHGQ